jgi:hypothetical protein
MRRKASLLRKQIAFEEEERKQRNYVLRFMKNYLNHRVTDLLIGYKQIEIPELSHSAKVLEDIKEARHQDTHKKAINSTLDMPGVRYEYNF